MDARIENEAGGWFCTSLDLGSPTVRGERDEPPEPVDGVDDTSMYLGSRLVSADITAMATVGAARIDEIAAAFGPFMHPAARPVLHYTCWTAATTRNELDDVTRVRVLLARQGSVSTGHTAFNGSPPIPIPTTRP